VLCVRAFSPLRARTLSVSSAGGSSFTSCHASSSPASPASPALYTRSGSVWDWPAQQVIFLPPPQKHHQMGCFGSGLACIRVGALQNYFLPPPPFPVGALSTVPVGLHFKKFAQEAHGHGAARLPRPEPCWRQVPTLGLGWWLISLVAGSRLCAGCFAHGVWCSWCSPSCPSLQSSDCKKRSERADTQVHCAYTLAAQPPGLFAIQCPDITPQAPNHAAPSAQSQCHTCWYNSQEREAYPKT
jgi:hypothetical protein